MKIPIEVTKTTQEIFFNGVFTYHKKKLDIGLQTGFAGEIIFSGLAFFWPDFPKLWQ